MYDAQHVSRKRRVGNFVDTGVTGRIHHYDLQLRLVLRFLELARLYVNLGFWVAR